MTGSERSGAGGAGTASKSVTSSSSIGSRGSVGSEATGSVGMSAKRSSHGARPDRAAYATRSARRVLLAVWWRRTSS